MTELPYTAAIPKAPPAPQNLGREAAAWHYVVTLALRGEGGGEVLPGWPQGPQLQVVTARAVIRYPTRRRKRDDVATSSFLAQVLYAALCGLRHPGYDEGKWMRRPADPTAIWDTRTVSDPGGAFHFEGVEISEDLGPGRTLLTLEYSR
jgi:hypothetical protein